MVSSLTGKVGLPSASLHSSRLIGSKMEELQEIGMFSKMSSFMNTFVCRRRMSTFEQIIWRKFLKKKTRRVLSAFHFSYCNNFVSELDELSKCSKKRTEVLETFLPDLERFSWFHWVAALWNQIPRSSFRTRNDRLFSSKNEKYFSLKTLYSW